MTHWDALGALLIVNLIGWLKFGFMHRVFEIDGIQIEGWTLFFTPTFFNLKIVRVKRKYIFAAHNNTKQLFKLRIK